MLAVYLFIMLFCSCESEWHCPGGNGENNPTTSTTETGQNSDCDLKQSKQTSCDCVKKYFDTNRISIWCQTTLYAIEVARFKDDETGEKAKDIKYGVRVKPKDFTDKLESYEAWNLAANNKSHHVLDETRRLLCQSKFNKDDGDYIYSKDIYEQKTESKTFHAEPGKNTIHFQLATECRKGRGAAGEMFRVYFNKFTMAKVNDPAKFLSTIKPPCKIAWPTISDTKDAAEAETELDYYCSKTPWSESDY